MLIIDRIGLAYCIGICHLVPSYDVIIIHGHASTIISVLYSTLLSVAIII
jgi:hypothetical protein